MIDNITSQDLRRLAETTAEHCVSIFLPTHRAGYEQAQDLVRLKNLLTSATAELTSLGLRQPEAEALLAPATALLHEQAFWAHQDNTLALFLTEDGMMSYRLPEPVDELVVVTDQFHLKPLLPSVAAGKSFYVLVLNRHEARLLRGSRVHVAEIELSPIPESLGQALPGATSERQLLSHSAGPVARGRVTATFHGHPKPGVITKDDLARFFSAVDDGINRIIPDPPTPLVLAGAGYLLATFRRTSKYHRIVELDIEGDPERLSSDELYAAAWPLVEPVLDQDRATATELYFASATPTTSSIPDALLAASKGQIETLFVPVDAQQWGTFAPDQQLVDLHEVRQPGDRDLLDTAAINTILHRGAVFTTRATEIPGNGPLAAILRY
ncbi:MAG: hypothetical protein OEV40_11010 [Acidimicrobiia bacterium]|nr:hypothetical protein [Acidimicrobiia bacterium]